jgi:hypothetical protein
MVHAVLQEALVDTLHVFVDRAHLSRSDKFGREAQPRILISLAGVVDEFDWVVILPFVVVPIWSWLAGEL